MTTVTLIVREHPTNEKFKRFLVPYDADDLAGLMKYGAGETVSIEVKLARNAKRHKLHHALFGDAVKLGCVLHGHRFHNKDALRALVYVCIGWCDYYDVGPARIPVARSINWNTIDETVFEKIFEQCALYMAEELKPECPTITAIADDLIARGVVRHDLRDAA